MSATSPATTPARRAHPGVVADASPGSRRRRLPPIAFLFVAIAAVCAYTLTLAFNTNTYTNDEAYYLLGGRLLEQDFFGVLLDPFWNRGPERLNSLVLWLGVELGSDAPADLRWGHTLLAIVYFLGAVPLYLLARGVGLRSWQAVLTASISLLTPWAIFGGTLLNVAVAYPATMLFAWAAWRGALRPSVGGDALMLAAAALNVFARTPHAVFGPVAVIAVVYAVWLGRPAGERVLRSLVRLPLRVARAHPLLALVSVGVLVLAAAVGTTRLVGPAYSMSGDFELPWESLWLHLRQWFVQLVMATGYLPMIVGGAWVLRQMGRPATRETGVFAVVAFSMFAVFVYASSNSYSTIEERYIAVLAGLPIVAFGAAVFRREAWVLGSVVIGLLAVRAIATVGYMDFVTPIDRQLAPARLFFTLPLVERTKQVLPGADPPAVLVLTLIILLVAVAVAVVASPGGASRLRRLSPARWPAVAGGIVATVLVCTAISGAWAMESYKREVLPQLSYEQLNWIDRATGGERTFLWADFAPETRDGRVYMGQYALYFNQSVCCNLWLNDVQDILGPDGTLPGPPAKYIARFAAYLPLGFESEIVARSRIFGNEEMLVERFTGAPRAAFRVFGAGKSGEVAPGTTARIELYPHTRREDRCLRIVLGSPPGSERALRYRVRAGDRVLRGGLRPTYGRTVQVPLDGVDVVTVTATSTIPTPNPLHVGQLRLVDCG